MSWWLKSGSFWPAIGLATVPTALLGSVPMETPQARSPAYEAARRQGLVGERVDGYLGFVVQPSPELRRLVADINIKRKALYIERAKASRMTADQYAFVAGCIAIARSAPGEKYLAPDGTWRTRGVEPPVRDGRCPEVGLVEGKTRKVLFDRWSIRWRQRRSLQFGDRHIDDESTSGAGRLATHHCSDLAGNLVDQQHLPRSLPHRRRVAIR